MPARLSAPPSSMSQVVVPTTKTFPLTRAGSSTFAGQRQYVMSVPQAGPSRVVPVMSTSRVSNQPAAVHSPHSSMVSHQGPPTLVPVILDDPPPRLDQRISRCEGCIIMMTSLAHLIILRYFIAQHPVVYRFVVVPEEL
ncbi:hypothetical protein NECAME_09556 [Necator americanus]|uniref:Uncharacterized protein n=1 Tax=Necator americanus TaxID=51031 RepID=W2TFA4_NECAM|nr:hypothetical protein NECAME_09556 [Necator americanus]ETN79856.1 hypothetical protein NECAME_09556 [Necator americanus]